MVNDHSIRFAVKFIEMENCHFHVNNISQCNLNFEWNGQDRKNEIVTKIRSIRVHPNSIGKSPMKQKSNWKPYLSMNLKDADENSVLSISVWYRMWCGYLHFMPISGFSIGRIINQFQFYLFAFSDCKEFLGRGTI